MSKVPTLWQNLLTFSFFNVLSIARIRYTVGGHAHCCQAPIYIFLLLGLMPKISVLWEDRLISFRLPRIAFCCRE